MLVLPLLQALLYPHSILTESQDKEKLLGHRIQDSYWDTKFRRLNMVTGYRKITGIQDIGNYWVTEYKGITGTQDIA